MSVSLDRLSAALADRYRIERELGAGGMATVYLADDLKHDRKVALKVLRPELAAVLGAERFVQEIKTTASLQHPHILPLFDSGEADGFLFYVMPFIDGETLRDKLDRETQLGIDEAVRITAAVADALDYAHRQGVVHRDIKPENILLHDGRPMVADFGIALALSAAAGGRMTETGLSLGTPHYMSPEQATAEKDISARSDVYSLASVLYEMLAGQPPHLGGSAQQIIMRIVTDTARPVTELRKSVPPNVASAVAKALEKLPADRFESAAKFAEALANPAFTVRTPTSGGPSSSRPPRRIAGFVIVALVLATLAVAVLLRPAADTQVGVARFVVPVGSASIERLGGGDEQRGRPTRTSVAFSPDGTLLAWVARDSVARLYLRRVDEEAARPVAGTEGASSPFFSPDGEWIGFFSGRALKRIPVAGGTAETMLQDADVGGSGPWGVSWGDDGAIVFGGQRGLTRLAPGEGTTLLVAQPDTGQTTYAAPEVLPGGAVVLFQRWIRFNPVQAEIVALEVHSGEQHVVLQNAMHPRYSAGGHLLFVREGVLMAVRFDKDRAEVRGEPVAAVDDVMQALFASGTNGETGLAQYAVSATGDLVYAAGGVFPEPAGRLARTDRSGASTTLDLEPRGYWFVRASPDGERLAFHAGPGQKNDIGVADLRRGVTRRIQVGGFVNQEPAWSPDGQWLAFSSNRDGPTNIYRIAADGSGEPVRLAPSDEPQEMSSWSSTGVIAYLQGGDIWVLPPDGEPAPLVQTPAFDFDASFSPDGEWLAYVSADNEAAEVFLRPYPGPGSAIQVSSGGGVNPAWSPDGRVLYYVHDGRDASTLMAVEVGGGTPLRPGRPRDLISPWGCCRVPVRGFDVLRDGSFVTTLAGDDEAVPVREIHVVLRFDELLRRRFDQ